MRNPDKQGKAGQAWIIDVKKRGGPAVDADVRTYMVKGKSFHKFWDTWIVSMIHLRDIPGMPPATLTKPNHTHEFLIMALDPGKDTKNFFNYDPDDFKANYLEPIDCCVQFECPTDVEALDLCDVAVQAIVNGQMSPDSDYASVWARMIPGTIACNKHREKKPQ